MKTLFRVAGVALVLAAGVSTAQDVQELEEQAVLAAAGAVAPSVVKIETLGGLERVGQVLVGTGPTTGLAVSGDGYVISSAFNFIQQPSSILVTLPSGNRAAATIVARDHSRMLVLLKVNAKESLVVPQAVPRDEIRTGQWSIAVGRTFDQPEPNLSVGVISAVNRIWGKAIQTDAKISPANYGGPLIDIHGHVLGVLVPLSPQGQASEVAGAEWYDSGIGFAVPLAEINERLEALKSGKDLHAGLLGVSLKPGDPYALPAEVAACQAGSPAYKAGLRAGDTIVELDGTPIRRQVQLKHALGPRYAGDKVHVVATRGKENVERFEADIELAEKLIPYDHPFLGLLPMRDAAEGGVAVRYVYSGSPAAEAGLKAGDKIVALDQTAVVDAAQLRNLVANLEPKTKTTLKIERGGESLSLELVPASLPTEIPAELPPARAKEPAAVDPAAAPPSVGIVEIKLPEEAAQCVAYVPENYHPSVPHGLVVVLSPAGPVDQVKLAESWKDVCEERQLIVLAPMSAAADKWQPTETAFVRKTIDDVVGRYNIDPLRIAAYGYQSGGSMAYLVGFEHVDRIRAIAVVDAIPPARAKAPDSDPINTLAFYLAVAEKSRVAAGIKALVARLEAAKLPVTQKSLGEQPRELSAEELAELSRWIDALDRI
ncbi:MAG TPA: PDZ domain-containing protein [Pirellulaceae bacterium]|nr:PDZ domain-containing protein [Pirellulaceae bacterium]